MKVSSFLDSIRIHFYVSILSDLHFFNAKVRLSNILSRPRSLICSNKPHGLKQVCYDAGDKAGALFSEAGMVCAIEFMKMQ